MKTRGLILLVACAVTLPVFGQYCSPSINNGCTGAPPPAYSLYESISNVTLGTLNNTSGCVVTPAYTDFTSLSAPSLQQGVGNPVSVTMANWWGGDTVEIYCDWDGDGIFAVPAEETILNDPGNIVAAAGTTYQTYTGSITPPIGAVAATRMRVILRFSSGYNQPCVTGSSYGESEDYSITTFQGVVPCTTAFSSSGPGNILVENTPCAPLAGAAYFWAFTFAPGTFPNGGWFGLDIGLAQLVNWYQSGYPFTGTLDGAGYSSFGTGGLPNIQIWEVTTMWAPGYGTFLTAYPPVTYTIP